MKAMILAAGRGERLRPMTDQIPKALVEARGRALIEHNICRIAASGVSEFVVNTAWLGSSIRARLGDGGRYGVSIRYSDEGDHALETGGGIRNALPLLGSETFWVTNADIWCDYSYQPPTLADGALAHIVLVANPPHNPGGDFSVGAGSVLLPEPGGDFTFSGISALSPRLFDHVNQRSFPLAPLLRTAATRGEVTAEIHAGAWFDVGTLDRLAELDEYLGKSQEF